jgi:hypothetical protein
MFSDPQSVTYATVAKSLPKIGNTKQNDGSVYRMNDGTATYTLQLSHQFAKRNRVVARLQRDVYVSDPLVPANSIPSSSTCTCTVDFPSVGALPADAQSLAKALVAFLTDANVLKLVNGET